MQDFRQLKVWVKAHENALHIYRHLQNFPGSEKFALSNQIWRASISIGSNIAEGCGCQSRRGFARYLGIAFASASELEYQIILSMDLKYLTVETAGSILTQITQIKRMLNRLIIRLQEADTLESATDD